jgi:hypothetical protein
MFLQLPKASRNAAAAAGVVIAGAVAAVAATTVAVKSVIPNGRSA